MQNNVIENMLIKIVSCENIGKINQYVSYLNPFLWFVILNYVHRSLMSLSFLLNCCHLNCLSSPDLMKSPRRLLSRTVFCHFRYIIPVYNSTIQYIIRSSRVLVFPHISFCALYFLSNCVQVSDPYVNTGNICFLSSKGTSHLNALYTL